MSESNKKGGLFGFFRKKNTGAESTASEIIEDTEQQLEKVEQELEQEASAELQKALESEPATDSAVEVSVESTIEEVTNDTPEDSSEPELEDQLEHEVELALSEADKERAEADKIKEINVSEKPTKQGFFARLKSGLSKTRGQLSSGVADLVLGAKQIDDDLLEEIETQLLVADVGVAATRKIIDDLTEKAARKELKDPQALMDRLQQLLAEIIAPCSAPLKVDKQPFVILMVGVNGVGKTTTIGKLAKKFQNEGKSVMLAAGDTFRAAAVEQLQVWGERNDIHVTAQHTGADSASVIFDALQAAQAREIDVLIADTAGRLHTKSNLMDELSKVKRVMQKLDQSAPHEIMLVVDAGTGQNALTQAEQFHKAVGLTGISISKLDGTAKGGVLFALADKLSIPIRFIGVGEGIDDLREFDSHDFINALFSNEQS